MARPAALSVAPQPFEADVMYSTELLVQTFISGLMIGVLYALMALGITFIY